MKKILILYINKVTNTCFFIKKFFNDEINACIN